MVLAARVAAVRNDPAFATLSRSLEVYYGNLARDAAMDDLYGRFLGSGELAAAVRAGDPSHLCR